MTEDEIYRSPCPYTLFRLMAQTRRALWALQRNDPDKAAAILRRQLEDCERTINATTEQQGPA